jgi:hypothetical protein
MGAEVLIYPLVVTGVAVHVGRTLGRDRPQLDSHAVGGLLGVREGVRVAADTAKLRPATAKVAAFQTEPEVLLQVTLGAVPEILRLNLPRRGLLHCEDVLAARQLLLPRFDLLFPRKRVGLHDGVHAALEALDGQRRVVAVVLGLGGDGELRHFRRRLVPDNHLAGAADVEH